MSSTMAANTTLAAPGAATADANYYQAATQANITAATAAISNALRFATSKSIRTSTIILASFNAFAAFITAVGIIHGCRTYRKRMPRRASDSPPSGLFCIHTVEVFPLVLSLGIAVQSTVFAASQSIGLQALLSRGCTIVAIFMLPAVFIVPFIHLVFGVEAAVRAVRSNFAPRGRWNVGVCLAIVSLMTVVTLIVAAVDRAPDFCFASLFWFVRSYAEGCFAVFVTVAATTLIVIATIFGKLRNAKQVSPTERMAATRMIYYLALGFISEVFVLPYFFSLTFMDQKKVVFNTLTFAMVAAVVANVNGLMVAGLHLFLRSKDNSTRQNFGDYERKEDMYDSHDRYDQHRGSNHSLHPVKSSNSRPRSGSHATLLHSNNAEDGRGFASPMSYGTARTPFSPRLSIPSNPAYPEPTQAPSETSPSQIRKQSYSLFPQDTPAAAAVLPATTYSPMASKPVRDTYKPPPVVKPWMGRGHKRDSSITSTATVQIGIRFSNVDDYVPRKSTDTEALDVPEIPAPHTMPVFRPSPLADIETRSESSYAGTDIILADPPRRSSLKNSRMKTLPPVPRSPAISTEPSSDAALAPDEVSPVSDYDETETLITLSPTVYQDPVQLQRSASNRSLRKLPSPMGVGFTPNGRALGDPRVAALNLPRPTGSAATTPLPTTKAEWI